MESFDPHTANILHAGEKFNTAYVSAQIKSRCSQRHNSSREADIRKKTASRQFHGWTYQFSL